MSDGFWSNSQFQKGVVTSGSGRSEMSSPGNASWCIRVRMSPGSTVTADTPRSRSSAASVLVSSSSAALLAPYGPHPGYAACGVARDVHDEPATLAEERLGELNQRQRRTCVDGKDATELLDLEVHQRSDAAELR